MGQKAVFFDRDDTLIEDPGYIRTPDQVKLLPAVARSLIQLKKMGYLLIVVTNQSGVARGYLTEQELDEIHRRMKNLLAAEGAYIDGVYYCPYHPEGTVPQYTKESNLRKPDPGMLLWAAREKDIDLERSWFVGDRYLDIKTGKAAGCFTILVDVPGKIREKLPDDPEPDRKAVNIREAVNIIRMHEFHQKAQKVRTPELKSEQTPPIPTVAPALPPQMEPVMPESINSAASKPLPYESSEESPTESELPLNTEPAVLIAEPVDSPQKPAETAEEIHSEGIEQMHRFLEEILHRLKGIDRAGLYPEFSISKLLAGMIQVVAIFCLIVSVGFWLNPKIGYEPVLVMIGYAVTLQLLVIALLLMHTRD
jgi:D,D-heptose 1,7-bisphosphate phosphatase